MKFLKWLVVAIRIILLLITFMDMPFMKSQTKKLSPEKTTTYVKNGR